MPLKSLNQDQARAETPGCAHVLHFNNAGASLMPAGVHQALTDHLALEARIGGYEAHDAQLALLEQTYTALAQLIGAKPTEIAVIENATRAWDMAFYSIPFQKGDRILTSVSEYASNYLAFLQMAQRKGVHIDVVPNDASGQLSVEALKNLMDDRVKLIAVSHMPTNGGLVQPAEDIGQIARDADVLYLLDACQSVGQLPLDVAKIGCDMLSATGRKYLRGPRGTGFLYVREDRIAPLEPPFVDLHAAMWTAPDQFEIRPDARRFENWETYVAGKIGLGVAADYVQQWGIESIWATIQHLGKNLKEKVSALPGITVRDLGRVQSGIVTFTSQTRHPAEIKQALRVQNINVSVAQRNHTLLDMSNRNLDYMVRASVHYYNTEAEITRFCNVLESCL